MTYVHTTRRATLLLALLTVCFSATASSVLAGKKVQFADKPQVKPFTKGTPPNHLWGDPRRQGQIGPATPVIPPRSSSLPQNRGN
jgi:hypothetical protein